MRLTGGGNAQHGWILSVANLFLARRAGLVLSMLDSGRRSSMATAAPPQDSPREGWPLGLWIRGHLEGLGAFSILAGTCGPGGTDDERKGEKRQA